MSTVRIKHSILAAGTNLVPVDLISWGERKLGQSDMASLTAANNAILEYLSANNIAITVIKENINDQEVDVGVEIIFPDLTEFTNLDAYQELYSWVERMRGDSDIKVFNWMEVVD